MLLRRFFIYSIGFFLGSILVYFLFFKNQDRSFFPSAIVLDSLRSKDIIIGKKNECLLAYYKISNENFKNLLREGEVNFSESSPRETPKKYVVEIETSTGDELKIIFALSPSSAEIISVIPNEIKAECACD